MEERRVPPTPHSLDALMGERLFPGGLVIADHEVEYFLMHMASGMARLTCQTVECEVCVASCRFWWDWCNSLHGANRIRMQRRMRELGVPLPPHFGDVVGGIGN
jgi:hypothetical protein